MSSPVAVSSRIASFSVRPYEHNRHYYAKYAPVLIVSASGDDTASPLQDLYELENSSTNGNLKVKSQFMEQFEVLKSSRRDTKID